MRLHCQRRASRSKHASRTAGAISGSKSECPASASGTAQEIRYPKGVFSRGTYWDAYQHLKNFDTIFVVIDTLDECSDSVQLDSLLREIEKLSDFVGLRLLTTFRPGLEAVTRIEGQRVEIRAHDEDVALYLNKRLDKQFERLP
jgi:hypothetical protein